MRLQFTAGLWVRDWTGSRLTESNRDKRAKENMERESCEKNKGKKQENVQNTKSAGISDTEMIWF